MKTTTFIIIVLALALLIFGGFYTYDKYQDHNQQIFTKGYQQGGFELADYQGINNVCAYTSNRTGDWKIYFKSLNEICGGAG